MGFGSVCVWTLRLDDAAGAAKGRTTESRDRNRIVGRTIAVTSATANGIAMRAEAETP